ncbi:unnamed protein product [Linum tenue]|uniref:ETFB lysine methyltransferase n=1 Tax=Linum tenue TaxID=586396 RepID=A0AAV0JGT8_9ROSI|nr:unnamed protein product [Linum tenue]
MFKSHFIKHLSFNLNRALIRRPYPLSPLSPSPITPSLDGHPRLQHFLFFFAYDILICFDSKPDRFNRLELPELCFRKDSMPAACLPVSISLKSLITGGECFLDYGTGSGILAIAALKFGAARSFGIDVDEQAIKSARRNAVLNNIEPEKLKHVMLLYPLLELADDIVSFAKP